MATFARRLVLDVGAGEVRMGEITPDKKGFPVFTMLRTMELSSDPTKRLNFSLQFYKRLELWPKRWESKLDFVHSVWEGRLYLRGSLNSL